MNCKNVEPLLSLYVGRDLEEERSRLVAAHLQCCTECTLAADEYAQASRLLQGYEPPFFCDETYAEIRGQVLREIESEFHIPVSSRIFSQFHLALVQPRTRWITAALLLAISLTALYLNRNHSYQLSNDKQVAVRTRLPNQAGSETDTRAENSNEATSTRSLSNNEQDRGATPRRPIIGKRIANAGVVAANRSRQLDKPHPASAHAPLRVEIQTSDPNIRIIWLSGQRPRAGGNDGSKGI